ncbi:hypothetical protein ACIO3R_09310 [Streptomyces sp. NPDC087428]|uniref:hypothetical protein n=1 Tax=Streptomyces sp. NPDC087428 TaxID=3365788 RepID=UPI00380AADA0
MSPSRTDVSGDPKRPIADTGAGTSTGTSTSTSMFTVHLRRSERDGSPIRTVWATVPAKAEHGLTPTVRTAHDATAEKSASR